MAKTKLEKTYTFHGVKASLGVWVAIGASPEQCSGTTLDFGGGYKGDRAAGYAIELIERARDELNQARTYNGGLDEIVMRRAVTLYGADRMARTLSALSSSLADLKLDVRGLGGLAEVIRDLLEDPRFNR